MSNIALDTLIEKRDKLESEKQKAIEQFDEQIKTLTKTIQQLGGNEKPDWGHYVDTGAYDDESHNSIAGTEDGI